MVDYSVNISGQIELYHGVEENLKSYYGDHLIIKFSFSQISSENKNGTGTFVGSSPIRIKTIFFEGITLTYCPFLPIPDRHSGLRIKPLLSYGSMRDTFSSNLIPHGSSIQKHDTLQ